ncbi:MAG: hypothetical protein ACI83E_002963 [Sulfitobacter sp.]|jgi:hypothetical protein
MMATMATFGVFLGAKVGVFYVVIGAEPDGGRGWHVERIALGYASATDNSSSFTRAGFSVGEGQFCKACRSETGALYRRAHARQVAT